MKTRSRNIALWAALGLTLACGSSGAQDPSRQAGVGGDDANGAAGSGDDGMGSGNAATAVSGGTDCTSEITVAAPSGGLIADFAGSGAPALGALEAFPLNSPSAPTFSTTNGSLHITENAPATAQDQYVNVLLGFEGCVDASAFTGVQFSISGTVSGCTMQYATADVAHQEATSGAPYATGAAGTYQPQATIQPAQLGARPQTLVMPFVNGPSGGNPATPIDPTKLIFLLWQFTIEAAPSGAANCVADVSIDDITLY